MQGVKNEPETPSHWSPKQHKIDSVQIASLISDEHGFPTKDE
jgi:hypothetical protein